MQRPGLDIEVCASSSVNACPSGLFDHHGQLPFVHQSQFSSNILLPDTDDAAAQENPMHPPPNTRCIARYRGARTSCTFR